MRLKGQSTGKPFLVITRAGDFSLHPSWMEPPEFLDFDLCLIYYGSQPGRYKDHCSYYLESDGDKWPAIESVVDGLGRIMERYQAIWIPDERLRTNAFTISQMFHIFAGQKLWLAQPALAGSEPECPPSLRQNPEYILRYMNPGEWIAPIFTPDSLLLCIAAWKEGHTDPIPVISWPGHPNPMNKSVAVIDAAPVRLLSAEAVQHNLEDEPEPIQEAALEQAQESAPPPPEPLPVPVRKARRKSPLRKRTTRSGSNRKPKLKKLKSRKPITGKKLKLVQKLKNTKTKPLIKKIAMKRKRRGTAGRSKKRAA